MLGAGTCGAVIGVWMSGLRLLGPWGCPNPGVGVPGAGGSGQRKAPKPGGLLAASGCPRGAGGGPSRLGAGARSFLAAWDLLCGVLWDVQRESRGATQPRGVWGTRPAHPRGRAASAGATAEAAGWWVSSRGRWPRRGARGCRERVSTDLSSAGRKEGRKRGRLEVLRSFLRRAGRARASRDAALCPPLPRGPRRWGAGTCPRHGFAATGSATASGAGPAGAPSEGSRAVHRFWGWPGV